MRQVSMMQCYPHRFARCDPYWVGNPFCHDATHVLTPTESVEYHKGRNRHIKLPYVTFFLNVLNSGFKYPLYRLGLNYRILLWPCHALVVEAQNFATPRWAKRYSHKLAPLSYRGDTVHSCHAVGLHDSIYISGT